MSSQFKQDFPSMPKNKNIDNDSLHWTNNELLHYCLDKVKVREAIEKHCDCLNLHNQILPCSACRVKKELGLGGEQK